MPTGKSSFLDKIIGRIPRLDTEGLQTVLKRLARERTFLETLFNTIEDGVVVVAADSRILYFNRAATHLLGLPPQGVEGQPAKRFLPDLDWDKLTSFDRASGRSILRHELEVAYPRPRFLSLYVAPIDGDTAGSDGLALIIHDVTEAREKTFQAIESERIQALTLLAASVAHEIGNPLNALSIHLQLMEREIKKLQAAATGTHVVGKTLSGRSKPRLATPPAEYLEGANRIAKFLGVCKGEITRLDYIITQFLQAIRPSPPRIQPTPLNDIVRQTLVLLQPEIENRGISVKEKLARSLPLTPVDPAQIKQVLVNLIKNALQAMTKGGLLTLQTDAGPDGVYLVVADTGGGIPQEQLQHIFEPFYTTKKKGTGLGLMIVQRIVREHQGRMELESRVGFGTRFRIWLPLHERRLRLLEAGELTPSKATP